MSEIHLMIPNDVSEEFQREVSLRAVMGNINKESYLDVLVAMVAIALHDGKNVVALKSRQNHEAEKGEG